MGIYEKIFKVMEETERLEKKLQVGKGQSSYEAVGEAEVLNMLKPLFKKHKLIVFPVDGEMTETNSSWESTNNYNNKETKETKTRNVTQLKVKFKIVDVESGEHEMLCGFGNGADSQDKGSGKAFTYAFKTMLSKTFMLFSGEDTDNDHSDDLGNNKPKQSKSEETVTTQQLIDMAKSKNVSAEGLIKKYKADTGKTITDVKFIPKEIKLKYYNALKNVPEEN